MPLYNFKCNNCNNEFEIMCSMTQKDNKEIACPSCGASELDRIFEGFTVRMKESCTGGCGESHSCKGCCKFNS